MLVYRLFREVTLHSLGHLIDGFSTVYILFFISLLLACPTHTNPPGSGLGTGGILFDKHIDKVHSR